jgi:hypothetical protein
MQMHALAIFSATLIIERIGLYHSMLSDVNVLQYLHDHARRVSPFLLYSTLKRCLPNGHLPADLRAQSQKGGWRRHAVCVDVTPRFASSSR